MALGVTFNATSPIAVRIDNTAPASVTSPDGTQQFPIFVTALAAPTFQVIDDRPANPGNAVFINLTGIWGAAMLRGYASRQRRRAAFAATQLKLVFGNFCASISTPGSMVSGPNPFEIQAVFQRMGTSVIDYTPTRIPVTWNNGQKFATCYPGQIIISDACPFPVEAGELYFSTCEISVPGPNWLFPQGIGNQGGTTQTIWALNTGDGARQELGVEAGTNFSGSPLSNAAGPLTVLGYNAAKQKSVAILGDSLQGTCDDGGGLSQGYSWGRRLMMNQRAIGLTAAAWSNTPPNFPFTITAKSGDQSSTFASQLYSSPAVTLAQMSTTVLWCYGINDVASATPIATLQGYTLKIARFFIEQGIKFIASTLTPYTTSTDSYSTVANQTVTANEAIRTAYNSWIRDASSAGFIASAAATGGPVWLPNTAYQVGYISMNGTQAYQVMIAGTSAGSGGPTGVGANIVDNGVTWKAIAPFKGLADFVDPCVPVEVNAAGAPTLNGGFFGPPPVASDATGTLTSAATSSTFGDTVLAPTEGQWNGYSISMTSGTRVDGTQNFQLGYTPASLATNLILYVGNVLAGTPTIGDAYKIFRPIGSNASHMSAYGCMLIANYLNTPTTLAKFI